MCLAKGKPSMWSFWVPDSFQKLAYLFLGLQSPLHLASRWGKGREERMWEARTETFDDT